MKKQIIFLLSFLFAVTALNATGNADSFRQSKVKNSSADSSDEKVVKDVHLAREGGTLPTYSAGDVWKYMNDNVHFPADAELVRSDNSVIVHFVVEKDGSLTDIKVIRDIGYGTGKEAIRVLKKCPKWTPGEQNGKKVRVLYSLPITIQSAE